MKQKKMLALTLSQLEQLYRHELPELVSIAVQSDDAEAFKANLTEYIAGHPEVDNEAGKQIRLLIEFDGQEVHELSIGEQLPISTLSMLHSFLTGQWEEETETDLFIDLFQQFKRLHQPAPTLPSAQKIKTLTERWPSGLDEDVQHIRAKNKERILHALVQKIEHRKNPASRFHFEEGLSYEEKFNLVSEWWNDFRFHLAMAVKSPKPSSRQLPFCRNHVPALKSPQEGNAFLRHPLLSVTAELHRQRIRRRGPAQLYTLFTPTGGNLRTDTCLVTGGYRRTR